VISLGKFYSSPGMSAEYFSLVRAEGLTKVGEGGGVDGEDIVVHRVRLAEIPAFLQRKRGEGYEVDAKLLLLLGPALLQPGGGTGD
jgi:ADP-ribose pyrophosphatase